MTDHVKRHLAERLSLRTLAELAGLSPWRFSIVFRQHMGVPPHRYISLCRIEHARELLQQGVSAATVADACGFYDQSHFTRHFKHHCGMTPGQYALQPASAVPASLPAGPAMQMARSV
ncbi:helix-turn-helix transcriptional regulator [Pseudoxanthomonas yeongjuensis]|uniref:helix-turn-helix transcriptional regulator n=1 Tax=Pseudoxanthomonas yeongjuensis TaxID=377616 RepID=UPI001B87F158|nr:AraC family transcriptional regulator [Pseudoxanthomonas yeongjuensis]